MNQMTPKAARKLKRRKEHERLAKDAPSWHLHKNIWANDGAIYRPANKSVRRLIMPTGGHAKKKTTKKGRSISVYLFRIKTRGHDEVFLKIGITNSIENRFADDVVKYKFTLVNHVDGLTRKEALQIEQHLHALFEKFSYRPRFGFVTGGYTECFVDCREIVAATGKVFALFEIEKAKLGLPHTVVHFNVLDADDIVDQNTAEPDSMQLIRKSPSVELLKNQSL